MSVRSVATTSGFTGTKDAKCQSSTSLEANSSIAAVALTSTSSPTDKEIVMEWRRFFRLGNIADALFWGAMGALLLLITCRAGNAETLYPGFKCAAWQYPQIKCESHHVFPQEAQWRVYYWNDRSAVADFDKGLVVFLTAPDEHFAVLEMRFRTSRDEYANVRALVRWHDGRIQFTKIND